MSGIDRLRDLVAAEIAADPVLSAEMADQMADRVVARLLTRAATIWAAANPDAVLELIDADLATSANTFLYVAEIAACRVVAHLSHP